MATIAAVSNLSAISAAVCVAIAAAFATKPATIPESIDTTPPALMMNSPSFTTSHAPKKAATTPIAPSKRVCVSVIQSTTEDIASLNASNTGFATVS